METWKITLCLFHAPMVLAVSMESKIIVNPAWIQWIRHARSESANNKVDLFPVFLSGEMKRVCKALKIHTNPDPV